MENFPGTGPDYSSLAETPKSPEKKRDEDDDDDKEKKDKKLSYFERAKEAEKQKQEKQEKVESEEKEPPLKKLDEEEKAEVKDDYLDERLPDVQQELEYGADAEALAAAVYLDKVAELDEVTDEALENAVEETVVELGLDAQDAEPAQVETDDIEVESIEDEPAEPEDPTTITSTINPTPTPTPTPRPVVPPIVPPLPPTGPLGAPAGPAGPNGPIGFGGGPNVGGNVLRPTPNVIPNTSPDVVTERRHAGRYFLLGGVVGYLVGKRRGRIKTEQKMQIVQDKLQKEVVDLRQQIYLGEEKVRTIARENQDKKPIVETQIVEKLKLRQEVRDKLPAIELQKDIPRITESPEMITKKPELLGRFAVLSERPKLSETAKPIEKSKPIELMTIPEMLIIAERIPVEQISVRRLFETNRIRPDGLRRIVKAFLNGEQLERVLYDNLISKENLPYYETLHSTSPSQDQASAYGSTQTYSSVNASGQPNPPEVDQSHLEAIGNQAQSQMQPTQSRGISRPQTGIIVAVAVVASLLLLLILL